MGSAPTTALQASRPAVFVSGKEELELAQGLAYLSIRESVHGMYRCEAKFGNWGPKNNSVGYLYLDRKKLDFGKQLQIKINRDVLIDGRISALEADFPEGRPPELSVLLEDRLQDLRMTRRTRSFENVSDADLVRSIAADHGLQAVVDLPGPTHKVLAQVNQSDLAFLRERARSVDGELWADGSRIFARSRSKRDNGTLTLNYGGDLREFCVLADLAGQRNSLAINGWDVPGKEAIHEEVDSSILQSELHGDTSAADILKSAFKERKEAVCHTVPLTATEGRAQAEAAYKAMARQFLKGRGVAQPNARIHVGAYVDLRELGPLFSGKYYVSEVHQAFDSSGGFRTEFVAERPGLGKVG